MQVDVRSVSGYVLNALVSIQSSKSNHDSVGNTYTVCRVEMKEITTVEIGYIREPEMTCEPEFVGFRGPGFFANQPKVGWVSEIPC